MGAGHTQTFLITILFYSLNRFLRGYGASINDGWRYDTSTCKRRSKKCKRRSKKSRFKIHFKIPESKDTVQPHFLVL